MARVKLTKTLVDDIQPPAKGQAFVWDAEIPGFGVRITPTGIKAWIVQMRVRGGKERRMTVGLCSKVPLDKARIEARKLIANADLGRDVAQERKEARQVRPEQNPTFEVFAERWLNEVVERRNRASTLELRRLLLKNHVTPKLGSKRIAEISRKDIEDTRTASADYGMAHDCGDHRPVWSIRLQQPGHRTPLKTAEGQSPLRVELCVPNPLNWAWVEPTELLGRTRGRQKGGGNPHAGQKPV